MAGKSTKYLKGMGAGAGIPEDESLNELGIEPSQLQKALGVEPDVRPLPTPDHGGNPIRSKQEADANYEQVMRNLAASRVGTMGINPPGYAPTPVVPAPQPPADQNRARMNALDMIRHNQIFPGTQMPQQNDMQPPAAAPVKARSPISTNKQLALPSPVGSDEDENTMRAIQRARKQEQEDNE